MKSGENDMQRYLHDFLDLKPENTKIDGNDVRVASLSDFKDIGGFYAFLYVTKRIGYSLLLEKENLRFDGGEDEIYQKIFVLAHFMKDAIEKA